MAEQSDSILVIAITVVSVLAVIAIALVSATTTATTAVALSALIADTGLSKSILIATINVPELIPVESPAASATKWLWTSPVVGLEQPWLWSANYLLRG